MRLLYTHDGAIGLEFDPACDLIWCHTQAEALNLMWAHFGPRQQFSKQEIAENIAIAIDTCAKEQHEIAYFGVLGSFMYSEKEKVVTTKCRSCGKEEEGDAAHCDRCLAN